MNAVQYCVNHVIHLLEVAVFIGNHVPRLCCYCLLQRRLMSAAKKAIAKMPTKTLKPGDKVTDTVSTDWSLYRRLHSNTNRLCQVIFIYTYVYQLAEK